MSETRFDRGVLDALAGADEVRVETRRDGASPGHGTTIWVVVVDGDVFVRSVRGEKGRWYREALANPGQVALRVDGEAVFGRVVSETNAETIGEVSRAFREKYEAAHPGPTAGMVREEVLHTTLKLLPA